MTKPLLTIESLKVHYPVHRDSWKFWRPSPLLKAVDDISFSIHRGETLGIVGESGCGKSSLAKALVGLTRPSSGKIIWCRQDITHLSQQEWQPFRKDIQMIFQDPQACLNPRMTIGDIIAEPLKNLSSPSTTSQEIQRKVRDMMMRVNLSPKLMNRYPHEFSNGQCQRAGIARALITHPKLVICDEPVSALDVSIQAQVIALLKELKEEMHLSLIFISHDLQVVQHICDKVMVMYLGKEMESAPAKQLFEQPRHPYSQALISAIPTPNPDKERSKIINFLEGELPSPVNPPSGCVFRTRCPIATSDCAKDLPPLVDRRPTHQVACIKAVKPN